jgi:hypothetical protein
VGVLNRDEERCIFLVVGRWPDGYVFVYGDTWRIRNVLKRMGFKYDPVTKHWIKKADVNKVLEELEKIPRVWIMGYGGRCEDG